MEFALGTIEGYYGKAWSWAERADTIRYLAAHEYRFYIYAPKVDPYLRRLWQQEYPDETTFELERITALCHELGVRFGVGLSPLKLHEQFADPEARAAFARKLEYFDALGVDDLAILFDDMRGDVGDLADRQLEIVHWAAARTRASRVIMCPSYYSSDPILDRIFGQRPSGYLEQLGEQLDSKIEIFWTGEEVCSRAISAGHIARVSEQLRRKPFLWDNYPVNDGERMSQYLHVRAFTGRDAKLRDLVAAHGVNPALQPTLTRIPALTLLESYACGDQYEYGAAFRRAAIEVLGESLGRMMFEDGLFLQDFGIDRLGERANMLRERYRDIDHPAAREIIGWLDGEYRITDAIVKAMAGEE